MGVKSICIFSEKNYNILSGKVVVNLIFLKLYLGRLNTNLKQSNFTHMKNILVIEDDKLISSLVKFRLKKDGYNVTMAEDGLSGMDMMNANRPDLIITDVMIPFKNGIEIINHAKKIYPLVPIIVLSSLGEEESTVMEAFNLGASDFIPKPFNPNELAVRVKRLINAN
jgi:DNA-binding response OmpR family regulator